VGKKSEGVFCKAQRRYGIEHFAASGYKIFPAHVGIHGVKGWPDFAVARYRRVILVECMSDWWVDETLQKKSEVADACELWFIAEPGGKKELRKRGYVCEVLPCPDNDEFRDLNTTFWLCRPRGRKPL
jgi:hypothetical protein